MKKAFVHQSINHSIFRSILFVALLVALTPQASAATKYWIGSDGGSFATASNWSLTSGGAPTSVAPIYGDSAIFDSAVNTNASITASMTGSSIEIRDGYTKNITLNSSVKLVLNTLKIGSSSSTVILGTNSKLVLKGNGTPLTGTGTLDTSTNTPNTVEYLGQGTTNITTATPASSYNNLTINPAGFSRQDELVMSAGANNSYGSLPISIDGFGYFTTSNGNIVKVRLSDFTEVAKLSTGLNSLNYQVIEVNGFLYLLDGDWPAHMAKVRLSDFTMVGGLLTFTGYNEGYGLVADPTGTYALVTFNNLDPAQIFRVRLSDMTVVDSLTFSAGEGYAQQAVSDGTYAYFGTWSAPGKIIKVRFSDFTKVGTLTLNTGENYLGNNVNAIADTTNGFLYFPTYTSPEKIVKIRTSDFTQVGTFTLSGAEGYASAIALDVANGFMYIGTTSNPSIIIKVRLSDFTRVSTLTLNAGDSPAFAHIIDNGYFYTTSSSNSPGKILRINLGSATPVLGTATSQSLTVTGDLTLGDGTNAVSITGATYNPTTTVAGNVTINTNASFTAPSILEVAGNWVNRGTFTANDGTVTLNGTNQSLSGSTTFASLTKTVSLADTLTFAASSLQSITDTLTLRGIAGALLSLRSSLSGAQWYIDPQGTRDIQYVSVQDSLNSNTMTIEAGIGSTNEGNNAAWKFPSTISFVSSPSSSYTGDSVTLSATVSPAEATGNITFRDNGTTLGSVALVDGVASLAVSNFTVGTHSLTATYGGNSIYNSSVTALSHIVNGQVSQVRAGGGGFGSRNARQDVDLAHRGIDVVSYADEISTNDSMESVIQKEGEHRFNDIPHTEWYAEAVYALEKLGIISGFKDENGNPLHVFKPAEPVTYAQFAKMSLLARDIMSGKPTALPTNPKNNSAQKTWAASYIAEAEILFSLYRESLNVHEPMPRGATAQTLLELLNISPIPSAQVFSDVPTSHPYYQALMKAVSINLFSGDDDANTMRPDDVLTRAEAAKLIDFVLKNSESLLSSAPLALQDEQIPTAGGELAIGMYMISKPIVHLRSEPSLDSSIIKVLRTNEFIHVVATTGSWVEVERKDGLRGFVYNDSLLPLQTNTWPDPIIHTTIKPFVNLRGGAFIDSYIRDVLPQGTKVWVLGHIDVWSQVVTESGQQGYIATSMLK